MADGRARGMAFHESFHSLVGEVVEISLENNQIRVHNVTCVVDCGRAINPDSVIAQMESGIIFGLTAALHGRIDFDRGQPLQDNFPNHRMVHMHDAPTIRTFIIENGEELGGVGEPGTPPVAPALANALFKLTGTRQRSLPLLASA